VKVQIAQEVDVPGSFLFYDIGKEEFFCAHCKVTEKFLLIGRVLRGGDSSPQQVFLDYIQKHTQCILRYKEQYPR
jgi:hypothetical protein